MTDTAIPLPQPSALWRLHMTAVESLMQKEIDRLAADNAALRARVKVLEDALREYIAAADYSASGIDDVDAMLRFGDADKAARAALKKP